MEVMRVAVSLNVFLKQTANVWFWRYTQVQWQ